jgi:hypothetical protein
MDSASGTQRRDMFLFLQNITSSLAVLDGFFLDPRFLFYRPVTFRHDSSQTSIWRRRGHERKKQGHVNVLEVIEHCLPNILVLLQMSEKQIVSTEIVPN